MAPGSAGWRRRRAGGRARWSSDSWRCRRRGGGRWRWSSRWIVALTEGVRLFGRIDRVDERAQWDLHVIDYKTGRAQEEPDPEQLRIYAMILARTAGRPVGMTSYLYLEDGSVWSASPTPAELAEAEAGVLQTVEEIAREREYAPDVGPQCTFCDFRGICPRREEIAARGAGAMNADLRVPL
ncbi:MAG: PD-(D/E)XK nuclease family protein [Dehalococcoidia bacterium]|nr:PD-(D/E)XK nuclease family protein [Dehalococcoidia bacterium]